MLPFLALAGVLAGVLTTVAGMGGGMLLVLALSLAWGPGAALASTAPALLFGNVHRAFLFRRAIDRRVASAFALGALPGSLAGGLAATAIPEGVLRWLMIGMTALAVARAAGLVRFRPPAASLVPAAAGVGAASATTGGAGLLASPLLMATGLTGDAYVATGACAAVSMHVGRIAAYGAGGLFTRSIVLGAAVLAAAILAGNLLGRRLRRHVPAAASTRIELAALVGSAALAVVGVGRG